MKVKEHEGFKLHIAKVITKSHDIIYFLFFICVILKSFFIFATDFASTIPET